MTKDDGNSGVPRNLLVTGCYSTYVAGKIYRIEKAAAVTSGKWSQYQCTV